MFQALSGDGHVDPVGDQKPCLRLFLGGQRSGTQAVHTYHDVSCIVTHDRVERPSRAARISTNPCPALRWHRTFNQELIERKGNPQLHLFVLLYHQPDTGMQGGIQETGMQHKIGLCVCHPRGYGQAEASQDLTFSYTQLLDRLEGRSIVETQLTVALVAGGDGYLVLTTSLHSG